MERHEIETFLALAEELHFRRTAERLGLSQGRVSQTIAKLERQVGVPLFERTSRQVALTAVGRQLRDDLAPAHRATLEAFARAVGAGRGVTGTLRVGFQGAGASPVVIDIRNAFRSRYPDCEVHIREVQLSDFVAPLQNGELDLLVQIFPIEEPGLRTGHVLGVDHRRLAVSAAHPLARRESLTMSDLAGETLLLVADTPEYWLRALFPPAAPDGPPLTFGRAVSTHQELLTAVALGEGVCLGTELMSRYYPRPDIVYVPVSDAPSLRWGLLWREAAEDARIRAFLEVAADFAVDE